MTEAPKAPRDAAKKKSGFYIMRQKRIAGNVRPDGSGVQYIYLDNDRLTALAKMTGNIEDESLIALLRTAEGFRELVAGFGVTVEADNREEQVDFAFQMYGRTDPNHSGTVIHTPVRTDGMEQMIWLDDTTWGEDDAIPGQIRFEFSKAGELATVDVKLYLRDGYHVPEPEEMHVPDPYSAEYQRVVHASLVQTGNNHRLKRVLEKAERGGKITLGFVGGSITQGAGAIPIHRQCYPKLVHEKFAARYAKGACTLIKAGVGGTPSELGMIRFERDVLRCGTQKPDVVVIEFAVNDAGDETNGECYESLVRHVLGLPWKSAVILLFMVFADDWNLQERLLPIGQAYHLPVISMRDAVVPQFYKSAEDGRVFSKSQYFYDAYHPSNMGHMLIADCMMYLLEQTAAEEIKEEFDWRAVSPVYGSFFEDVKFLDKITNTEAAIIECGSFSETDAELQCVEMDENFAPTPEFPHNWMHVQGNTAFQMRICCKSLLLVSKDSGETDVGRAEIRVDGKTMLIADPHVNGWVHCNAQIVFREKESREHLIEIRMLPEDVDKKFTILGFGYVQ